MTGPVDSDRLPLSEEAKLLTAAALYLLPLTIGLRAEPLGPNFILMLGLMAISVSKVLHLRQAVVKGRSYPPSLMATDFAIVLVLLGMFQLVARPLSLAPSYLWNLPGFLTPENDPNIKEATLLRGWKVFWSLGMALFGLIILWTTVAQRTLQIKRHTPVRYWIAWIAGLVLSAVMLHRTLTNDPQGVFAWYRWVAFAGLLPLAFLLLEFFDEDLFDGPCDHRAPRPPEAAPTELDLSKSSPSPTPPAPDRFGEYNATLDMIQDTARNVWVINGAYLVVAGLLARPLLDGTTMSSQSTFAWIGVAGLILSVLWLASFERNYAFYNFRIRYARMLEPDLGFRLFTDGETLSRTGMVTVRGLDPVIMSPIGRLASIQGLTRAIISLFLLGFGAAFIIGLCRLSAA